MSPGQDKGKRAPAAAGMEEAPGTGAKRLATGAGRGGGGAAGEKRAAAAEQQGGIAQQHSDYQVDMLEGESREIATSTVLEGPVLLISSEFLGRGEPELGRLLMYNFLTTLSQNEIVPSSLILMHSGVKLVCEGSPALESLLQLEKAGVKIGACGTCLDYYNLREKLCVGQVTSMYAIVGSLLNTSRVITL